MTDRFLSRWSRRKTAAKDRNHLPTGLPAADPGLPSVVSERHEADSPKFGIQSREQDQTMEIEETSVDPERTVDEEVEALGLPPIDSLGPGSDFKAFMDSHIPGRIRTLALRKLWGSNPILANLDGLIDYGEDFTDKALAVETLQTAYQVGRGYKTEEDLEEEVADGEVLEEGLTQAEESVSNDEPDTETTEVSSSDSKDQTTAQIEASETQPRESASGTSKNQPTTT